MAVERDARAALTASGQGEAEVLQIPELDAGFHLLYELKLEEARNQFEGLGRSPIRKTPFGICLRKRRAIYLRSVTGRAS